VGIFLDQKVKRILIWKKQKDLKLQVKLELVLKNIINDYFALQTLAQPMRNVLRTLPLYVLPRPQGSEELLAKDS